MLVAQRTCDKRTCDKRTCDKRTWRKSFAASRSIGLVSMVAALAMAGCSANITRLDAPPSFALGSEGAKTANTNSRQTNRQTADAPFNDGPSNVYASTPRNGGNVDMANLPPLTSGEAPRAMAVTRQQPVASAPSASAAVAQQAAPSQATARGQQIEVQPGDTLYGIGKRHKVMISELMAVNDLKNPNLKPGQKLYLPTGTRSAASVVKPQRPAPAPTAAPAIESPATGGPAPGAAPAPVAMAAAESYTVKYGDSLYSVAARHKIKVLDLQRANDITDVRKVKPGMVLKIPAAGSSAALSAPPATAQADAPAEPRIVRTGTPPPPSAAAPAAGAAAGFKVLNGDAQRQVAAAEPATRNDASPVAAATPVAAAANGKLRWPVKGRIVQSFGPRTDGSHNDGVDIAVPAGTDVMAAEAGVVAYAGNEVKTYGNLVLVRHDNGWVTAYANNDKILVNRGDRVKRGQAIAKAGKSGNAEQPQLHFEVRVGSKPVDPMGYLER